MASYESFIAGRILRGSGARGRFTNPVIRISMAAIALGMAVMIVAVLVVTGFRNEITAKVTGFGAHIRISGYGTSDSYLETPMNLETGLREQLLREPGIAGVHPYATRAGIIKTADEIEGIVLKGVDQHYDWNYLKDKIVSGSLPDSINQPGMYHVLISSNTASKLGLKAGDEMIVYFIEQPPRIRKFRISALYETGLEEFDRTYAYCGIDVIRKLNNWSGTEVGGLEVMVSDFGRLNQVNERVNKLAGFAYQSQTIREVYPQIFHWLELQNLNVVILIVLILLVAGISMISMLLIIIMENTSLIGILKTLGIPDGAVRRIFIRIALPVIGVGVIAGNLLGLGLCLIQDAFGVVTLPQDSYYVSQVPVNFSLIPILLLNTGTVVACLLLLIGPSAVIAKITPSNAIKFR